MPPPLPPVRPAAPPTAATPAAAGGSALRWLTDATLAVGLVAALLLVIAVDAYSARTAKDAPVPVALAQANEPPVPDPPAVPTLQPADVDDPTPPPPLAAPPEEPIDPTHQINFGCIGACDYGLVRVSDGKKLTFDLCGLTNSTMLRVDNADREVGRAPAFVTKDWPVDGKIDIEASRKGGSSSTEQGRRIANQDAYETGWHHPGGGGLFAQRGDILLTQRYEFAAGDTSRKVDTFKITYTLKNTGSRPRAVGLRTLVDTYIGAEDGVPFYVPGREGVVTSPLVVDDVPDFILALERPDLGDATMTITKFRFGHDDLEKPSRVALIRFPGTNRLDTWEFDTRRPFDQPRSEPPDSAVVLYFDPKPLAPGAERRFGYSYGLGDLSSQGQAGAKLALTAGALEAGKRAQVMVLASNVAAGRTVSLVLPPEVALAPGEAADKPIAAGPRSQQSWQVRVLPTAGGPVKLAARLAPDGAAAELATTVKSTDPAVKLVRGGDARVGGRVRLTANVRNAPAGATVQLELPPGTRIDGAEPAAKPVGAGPVAQASWVVWLDREGPAAFRARLTPGGAADVLTETVAPPVARLVAGRESKAVAGKPFWVWAQLVPDRPGRTATLTLPAGLTLMPGHAAAKPLEANSGYGYAKWLVRADAPGRLEASVAADGVAPAPLAVDVERASVIGN